MTTHSHPIAFELIRLTVELVVATLSIVVGLPLLLALANTAGR